MTDIKFTDSWLRNYVADVYYKEFGSIFTAPVDISWNPRLRTIGGRTISRYIGSRLTPTDIEINENMIKKHPKFLHGTVGHELTHYHCIVMGKPFRESNWYFRNQIKRHGFPLYLTVDDNPKRYVYRCTKCHQMFTSRGKWRSKYRHTTDHGDLEYIGRFQAQGSFYDGTWVQAVIDVAKAHLQRVRDAKRTSRRQHSEAVAIAKKPERERKGEPVQMSLF